jgi:hypothetical protein
MSERLGYYQRPEMRRFEEWGGLAIGMGLAVVARLVVGVPSFAYGLIAVGGLLATKIANGRRLARGDRPGIPIAHLNRQYLAELATRPTASVVFETSLMMTVAIGGILALAIPARFLTGPGFALFASIPVLGAFIGARRAFQVQRFVAKSPQTMLGAESGPRSQSTRSIFHDQIRSLPAVYAGTLVGVAVGVLVGSRLPSPYMSVALVFATAIGFTSGGMFVGRRSAQSYDPESRSSLQQFGIAILWGMLSFGVPMSMFFSGYLFLGFGRGVPEYAVASGSLMARSIFACLVIGLAGGACFGAAIWICSRAVLWSTKRRLATHLAKPDLMDR